jgi:tetratricopeptide (TPR) repeat protein
LIYNLVLIEPDNIEARFCRERRRLACIERASAKSRFQRACLHRKRFRLAQANAQANCQRSRHYDSRSPLKYSTHETLIGIEIARRNAPRFLFSWLEVFIMPIKKFLPTCLLIAACLLLPLAAQSAEPSASVHDPTTNSATQDAQTKTNDGTPDGQLTAINKLPPAERVEQLEAFIESNSESSLRPRALELLTVARAALGDEKLRGGDAAGGVGLFQLAVAEAPAEMPDKLFVEVVSQLPSNLFLRGENTAALALARRIEERVKSNPQRLLAVAAFYLSVEQSDEATRAARAAIKLAPEMAAAHSALGLAHRIALRLDAATTAFARALELDPRLSSARRNLADLYRAAGKSQEALTLYRELLTAEPKDAGAHAGVVLSLLDAGKKEEAEKELQAALKNDERNLALLVGAAYWHAAHNDSARALELAERAVRIEPRYTWAQIAYARALVAQKRPLEAERALRFVRQHGRFPTLDYELANTLVAAGLYQEAAEELSRSFAIKNGQIETQLAGRIPARAAGFTELLAPERRASIYQFAIADTETNARTLKGLLAFYQAMGAATEQSSGRRSRANEAGIVSAAEDFVAAGPSDVDAMRAFRQLYVAGRLLQRGVALPSVLEITEAAASGVEAALDTPVAAVAVLADSLRDLRARAIAAGATTDLPAVPRSVLSSVMRGRIEDIAGWALYHQGKAADATVRLRRAASVLPENTLWWRDALWHLGTSLSATGNHAEALPLMLRSYNRQSPNPARRAIVEALYTRVNGSLQGFDVKLGAALPVFVAGVSSPEPPTTSLKSETPSTTEAARIDDKTTTTPIRETTRTTEPNNVTELSTSPSTTSDPASNAPIASAIEVLTPKLEPPQTARPTERATSAIARESARDSQPTSAPPPTSETATNSTAAPNPVRTRRAREGRGSGGCTLSLSESELTIDKGGAAAVTASFGEPVDSSTVKAATRNWSDIIVLAEPASASDSDSIKFTITSISRTAGTFIVTFTSPCGKQDVAVRVK